MEVYVEVEVAFLWFLTSVLDGKKGQFHTPAVLPPVIILIIIISSS
jgi:hypothetical protein